MLNKWLGFVARVVFAAFWCLPFWWVNKTLAIAPIWSWGLVVGALLTAVPDPLLARIPRLEKKTAVSRLILFALVALLPLLLARTMVANHALMAVAYSVTWLILLGLSLAYRQSGAAANLVLATSGVLIALLFANLGAGVILRTLDEATLAARPIAPTPEPQPDPTPSPPIVTATPDPIPEATEPPPADPTPERPIAGYGYLEWLVDGGEAGWTHLTGFGPRVNSVAQASMYDQAGNVVYETTVTYNGKGYRGPEVDYEKPANTFRILIIGDSFVEALQVPYEQTFQARLQQALDPFSTPERRYEVVAMGRTGWGTVHETAFYQVEGYKYNADLVLLLFYINDVADNFPRFFYPGINGTNFDFIFSDDFIQIVDTNQQPLPPNNGRLLYNALPARLQTVNLAQLFIRLTDPPLPIQTPGGVMTRVHPQFYIYVTDPEPEGYDEGWERTESALRILAESVAFNGGQLAVMPVFLGEEMVQSVSNWFPELTDGWQWDASLPDQRLAAILADLPGDVWPTRPFFSEYANNAGGEVYNLIYLPEDGHYNALGHEWTAAAILAYLRQNGIVTE